MAAYPDPPSVILVPESIAAQAAYQLRYKNTEYYSWVSSGPKCFQVLGLSPTFVPCRFSLKTIPGLKTIPEEFSFIPINDKAAVLNDAK